MGGKELPSPCGMFIYTRRRRMSISAHCLAPCLPGPPGPLACLELEQLVCVACSGLSVLSGLACSSPTHEISLQLPRLPTACQLPTLALDRSLPPPSDACSPGLWGVVLVCADHSQPYTRCLTVTTFCPALPFPHTCHLVLSCVQLPPPQVTSDVSLLVTAVASRMGWQQLMQL